jgi:hypothetical protein
MGGQQTGRREQLDGHGVPGFLTPRRARAALIPSSSPGLEVSPMNEVTRILNAAEQGDPHAASQLLPLVSDELRQPAA